MERRETMRTWVMEGREGSNQADSESRVRGVRGSEGGDDDRQARREGEWEDRQGVVEKRRNVGGRQGEEE